jgi:perosamine synthetase
MCKFIKVKYAKATTSGTAALHLALLSLGVSKEDEVIIPSYVCESVLNAVIYTGAKPILADIDQNFENGFNISAKTIKPLITKKTKAIVVVHLFGIPVDIDSIRKISKKIPIIEDCAQSLGASYKGKMLGSFGDVSIFSFYATKVISTGHGGMVLTNSKSIKKILNNLTQYDKKEDYGIAYNYCLTDIQSALGLSQLSKLKSFLKRRQKIAREYDKSFSKIGMDLPKSIEGEIKFRYVLRTKSFEKLKTLQKKLQKKGIIACEPIFKPLHRYLKLNSRNFKNTELAQNTNLSIPIYPSLTEGEVNYIKKSLIDSANSL